MVTGAGSGIGRSVAVELLRAGWSVALAGRRTQTLEGTAALTPEGTGGASIAVRTDVSRPDDVAALFAATVDRFGRVDLLFNNAGTFGPGGVPVEELPYDAWRHVVDTNLNGAFLCAQAAYRQMKEQDPQGGRIINNGSISAHTPGRTPSPTPRPSTPSPASPSRCRWTGGRTASRWGRSTSGTRRPT